MFSRAGSAAGLAVLRGVRTSFDGKEIGMKPHKIKMLSVKSDGKEIGQGVLDLGIEKDTEINGIGMGVLSDGTPYLNQRGLAALCGVQNAHIGTISSQWDEADPKPRIKAIKSILSKIGLEALSVPHLLDCSLARNTALLDPTFQIIFSSKVVLPLKFCLASLLGLFFSFGSRASIMIALQ